MLAVLQLRFLCAAHRGFARSMLALSQEEAAYFPLATVSINVTAITLQVLRSKSCHRLLLEECDGYRSAPDRPLRPAPLTVYRRVRAARRTRCAAPTGCTPG